VGADYLFPSGTLAGVALGKDSSNVGTSFNNGNVGTSGYSVAPYFVMRLANNLALDGSIGFGTGRINANVGAGVTGSTNDSRNFASLGLTHLSAVGNWKLQSSATLMTSSNKVNQFSLSNAVVIASTTSGITQLRGGVLGSYGSGQFVPYAGLTYAQDLSRTDIAPVGGQTAANARGAFIVQGGVNINQAGVISGSVGLSSEMRKETRNTGLVATISMKF
jgi:hypothetical protein